MPDVDQYAPGTPSWVDVSVPDTDAAAAFYGGLFGWEAGEAGNVEETGGYRHVQRARAQRRRARADARGRARRRCGRRTSPSPTRTRRARPRRRPEARSSWRRST